MRGGPVAWLCAAAIQRVRDDAAAYHPLETGGTLMGYWPSDAEVVVTRVTLAGPKAIHKFHSFMPDQEHDEAEIARNYGASMGVDTYLGDWHTHPGQARPQLSGKDRATLKRIAAAEEARAPRPLTMIVAGNDQRWALGIWTGHLMPFLRLWNRLVVTECELRPFGGDHG